MPSSENWMRRSITTSISAHADELNGCVGRSGVLVRGGSHECHRDRRENRCMERGALPRFRSSSYANFTYQATDRSLIVVWRISNRKKPPWVLDSTSSSGHGVKGLHQAPTFECQRPLGI